MRYNSLKTVVICCHNGGKSKPKLGDRYQLAVDKKENGCQLLLRRLANVIGVARYQQPVSALFLPDVGVAPSDGAAV